MEQVTGSVRSGGTDSLAGMRAVIAYGSDGRAPCGPISVKTLVHGLPPGGTRVVSIDAVVSGGEERDSQGAKVQLGCRIGTAAGTAVGDVAEGFVVNDLAFIEAADEFVGEVTKGVGAGSKILWKQLSVLVGDLFANQLANIDPHLFVRLERLLQLILWSASVANTEYRHPYNPVVRLKMSP